MDQMKLKTMDDLPRRFHQIKYKASVCVDREELKDEAIEWVKRGDKVYKPNWRSLFLSFNEISEEDLA